MGSELRLRSSIQFDPNELVLTFDPRRLCKSSLGLLNLVTFLLSHPDRGPALTSAKLLNIRLAFLVLFVLFDDMQLDAYSYSKPS